MRKPVSKVRRALLEEVQAAEKEHKGNPTAMHVRVDDALLVALRNLGCASIADCVSFMAAEHGFQCGDPIPYDMYQLNEINKSQRAEIAQLRKDHAGEIKDMRADAESKIGVLLQALHGARENLSRVRENPTRRGIARVEIFIAEVLANL